MSARQATDLARALARRDWAAPKANPRPRSRRLAMGDPQAPLETVLDILDAHGLIGADGWLHPEVGLVSMGDHFDWGGPEDREAATADGTALLAWLAAHPADQVAILIGNHDLARVGELAEVDAETYAEARAAATAIYRRGRTDPREEEAFIRRFPMFPSAEVAARDLSAFSVEQRDLVTSLLRSGRLRWAFAEESDLLLSHAGVAGAELAASGLDPASPHDARRIALALNGALDAAVAAWTGGALVIDGLHTPGSAAHGEGGGALYHRPTNPQHGTIAPLSDRAHPHRRRYDPRDLPLGITQVIGHVRDRKCRSLLGDWADLAPAQDGVIRHLLTDGRAVTYAHGIAAPAPDQACVLFLDAGMQHIDAAAYPLLDLSARAVASRRPPWVSSTSPRQ